jgi:hypothetical protein
MCKRCSCFSRLERPDLSVFGAPGSRSVEKISAAVGENTRAFSAVEAHELINRGAWPQVWLLHGLHGGDLSGDRKGDNLKRFAIECTGRCDADPGAHSDKGTEQ